MMNDGFGSFPVLGEFDQCPEFILINKTMINAFNAACAP